MPLQATWVGRESLERIADVRMRCYGQTPAEREKFLKQSAFDRSVDGDVLILSDDTGDVATATSLSVTMNVRGTRVPCQGVAWVGTVRSHRRRRVDGRGLASRVMDALADKAVERGQAVGLLAPFRHSFYEAFGYGAVERQHTWTIPLSILPDGDTGGFAESRDEDFGAAVACRDRQFKATHGDIDTGPAGLKFWHAYLADTGFRIIDRQGDRVTSQFTLGTETEGDHSTAVVHRPFYDSPAALHRVLAMLGTLRDQYSFARITLPTDVPVNWWLKERQVPHRRVDHPAARCALITRMQGRIFDVPAFVAAFSPAADARGVMTVDVAGAVYRIEVADGHATGTAGGAASGLADLTFDAPTWAAVAFGDLPPATAAAFGRVAVRQSQALPLLAALVAGATPYCHEYF